MPSRDRIRPSRAWWWLLVLPAGFALGWGIGQLPSRPRPPAAAATSLAPVAPAPTAGPVVRQGQGERPSRGDLGAPLPPQAPPAVTPARPPGLSDWTTWGDARARSARDGKPILLDFNAEWCRPCRMLEDEVFHDPLRGEAVRAAVIPVSVTDRRREDGENPPEVESLQRLHGIEAFPTLIVYSPATGRSARAQGYGGAQRTLDWILQAAESVR